MLAVCDVPLGYEKYRAIVYVRPKILGQMCHFQVYCRILKPILLREYSTFYLQDSWYVYTAMEDGCPHAEFNALSY